MTQISPEARELLAKAYRDNCPPNAVFDPIEPDWTEFNAAPLSAIQEALDERDEARNANRVYDDATLDREGLTSEGAFKYGKEIGRETLHRVIAERDALRLRVKELEAKPASQTPGPQPAAKA